MEDCQIYHAIEILKKNADKHSNIILRKNENDFVWKDQIDYLLWLKLIRYIPSWEYKSSVELCTYEINQWKKQNQEKTNDFICKTVLFCVVSLSLLISITTLFVVILK